MSFVIAGSGATTVSLEGAAEDTASIVGSTMAGVSSDVQNFISNVHESGTVEQAAKLKNAKKIVSNRMVNSSFFNTAIEHQPSAVVALNYQTSIIGCPSIHTDSRVWPRNVTKSDTFPRIIAPWFVKPSHDAGRVLVIDAISGHSNPN